MSNEEIEKLLKDLNEEKLRFDEIINATCSDFEFACCGVCPGCNCHNEGTPEYEKWQLEKKIHLRGKRIGRIEKYHELLSYFGKLNEYRDNFWKEFLKPKND